MSQHDSNPSANHDLCKKCGFCFYGPEGVNSPSVFVEGAYFDPDLNEMVLGIPPKDKTPEGGWIVYIGEAMDETSEVGGLLSDRSFLRVFSTLVDLGVAHRVWYHPAVKCRPLVKGKIPDPVDPMKRIDAVKEPTKFNITLFRKCWHFIWPDIYKVEPAAIIVGGYEGAKMIVDDGRLLEMLEKRYSIDVAYPDGTRRVDAYPVVNTSRVWQDKDLRFPDYVRQLKKIFYKIDNPFSYDFVDVDGWTDFVYGLTPEIVEEWFDNVRKNKSKPLSWDVESTSVDTLWTKEFKLGIFSFDHPANEKPLIVLTKDYAFVDQVYKKHCKDPTRSTEELLAACIGSVEKVLTDPTIQKLGHNTLYDESAVSCAYGWTVRGFYADTLILAFLLNAAAQGGRKLNDLIRGYLPGMPEYWLHMDKFREENPSVGYNYCLYPPDLVIPYAAWDTKTVSLIFNYLTNELAEKRNTGFGGYFSVSTPEGAKEVKTYSLFDYAFRARRIHYLMCGYMERIGQKADSSRLGKVAAVYADQRDGYMKELKAYPEVREFEWMWLAKCYKEGSANRKKIEANLNAVRLMLAAERGVDPESMPTLEWERDKDDLLKYDGYRPEMSWASPTQASKFFFEFLGYTPVRYTDSDNPSTDEGSLVELAAAHDSEIIRKLLSFREVQKFMSSFIDPMMDKHNSTIRYDGLVHAQFKPSGIRTGRLSAQNPNLQQLPRDGEIRKLYCSRFKDGWMFQRDYSGLEVRVLACLSRDERLVDDFLNGRDPHFRTQSYFFGESADKHNKNQRSICKQVLFGRIYGQTDFGLYELLRGNNTMSPYTGEPVTLEECKRLNEMIDKLYPGVAEWVNGAHMQAIQRHHVCSPFGFVRPLPAMASWDRYLTGIREKDRSYDFGLLKSDIRKSMRQAQNTPIQSAASDITVYSAWWAKKQMEKEGLKSLVCCLVHDSIWVDVVDDHELPEVTRIVGDVMDHTNEWLPELLPGFDTSWMVVPIIGETELGFNTKETYIVSEEPSSYHPERRLMLDITPGDILIPEDCEKFTGAIKLDNGKLKVPFEGNQKILRNALNSKRNAF